GLAVAFVVFCVVFYTIVFFIIALDQYSAVHPKKIKFFFFFIFFCSFVGFLSTHLGWGAYPVVFFILSTPPPTP
ncbi:hypothetical protein ACSTIV_00060, partial [Vibrio parahaemolyticus]